MEYFMELVSSIQKDDIIDVEAYEVIDKKQKQPENDLLNKYRNLRDEVNSINQELTEQDNQTFSSFYNILLNVFCLIFLNIIDIITLGDNMNQYENAYFHGLAGSIVVMNADGLVINTSIEQLEKIIQTGGIYSRNKLKEHNIEYSHKPVENGNDFVSICVKNPSEEEFTGYNEGFESAFVPYVQRDRIALVINPNIENTHTFRDKAGTYMLPGERQVKEGIQLQDIIGITIMFENEDSMQEAASKVGELLERYNISIPLLDQNLNEMQINQIKR